LLPQSALVSQLGGLLHFPVPVLQLLLLHWLFVVQDPFIAQMPACPVHAPCGHSLVR
jgi:hypothetical protein